jgi:hypothetical protein
VGRALLWLPVALAPIHAQDLTLRIPPLATKFDIDNQRITVTTSGVLTRVSQKGDEELFRLQVNTDLTDLQTNITGLLRARLDRADRCGERISIQSAIIEPAARAALLTVQLHCERWTCVKALGKQINKRLVGGNAVIQVKLTPEVDAGVAVRLTPEITRIDADGSLGELLHSGSFGENLREKVRASLLEAIRKGTDMNTALPPAVREMARVQDTRFADSGGGRLALLLNGEVRIPHAQVQALISQLKTRLTAR